MSAMRVTQADLVPLARGAAVLGGGGGGDPHIGRLLAERALAQHGEVDVVPVESVPADACVLPIAMMGAPTVMVEKIPSVDQIATALETLARYLGRTPTHVACMEAGGVNSTVPFVAAARLGLPLIDGDAMGRAFPELQMVLPTLGGIQATPMSIVDEKGNKGVLDTIDNHWAERLARSATIDMGCATIVSLYAMTGAQVRDNFVPGTLSLCLDLGRTIERARAEHHDPVRAVADRLGGRVLHTGKVLDVARRTATGFARGEAIVEGLGDQKGSRMVLHFQNEHLLAELDGQLLVTSPDLIVVLDTDTGEPVTTEALRYGHRVSVVSAPCDERWHSPAGIELVGPRYFGYEVDPVRFDGSTSAA
ncbi:MAG: uncharacterized protein QOC93_2681 [Actinomycetota bacterium]|nr:hypothetical protein [Cryptosporangiaceae bacterium]MDQ1677537.1 uncharacterized protein [Actinomycetota bacterium]